MRNIMLLVVFLCSSCKKREFTGTFVANHKEGADTLIISQNRTYKHIFIDVDNMKYVKEDKWEMGAENNRIDFANFDWHLKGFGMAIKDNTNIGFWSVEVEYDLWGNPFYVIDYDRGFKYKQIKQKLSK